MGREKARTALLELVLDALDALDGVSAECRLGGDLLALSPALARLITLRVGELEKRLGHAVALLQGEAPEHQPPPGLETWSNGRRSTLGRWWSAAEGVVILCPGGAVFERRHAGPWRPVDLRGMTPEEYVNSRPGRWQDRSGMGISVTIVRGNRDAGAVEDGTAGGGPGPAGPGGDDDRRLPERQPGAPDP